MNNVKFALEAEILTCHFDVEDIHYVKVRYHFIFKFLSSCNTPCNEFSIKKLIFQFFLVVLS